MSNVISLRLPSSLAGSNLSARRGRPAQDRLVVDTHHDVPSTESSSPTTAETRQNHATQKAGFVLGQASSFVSVAQSAFNDVTNLVARAGKLATSIQSEVDPVKKKALANEAAGLLGQIDSLQSSATFNDQQVLNAGKKDFQFTVDSNTTQSTISISNIDLSRSTLGISTLTANDFQDNPADAIATLSKAGVALQTSGAALDKSASEIRATAEDFGLRSFVEGSLAAEHGEPIQFANALAASLGNSNLPNPHQLDASRVAALLDSAPNTTSSTTKTNLATA